METLHIDLLEAVTDIGTWLSPFGYTLQCDDEDLSEGQLGSYEKGSVFEKEILIHVSPDNIEKATQYEINDRYGNPGNQVRITVFHEVGHALLEQIIDWANNIPEIDELCNGPFGEKYFEVLDDSVEEETVVEDFAWGFFDGIPSPLQKCWEELNKFIEEQ